MNLNLGCGRDYREQNGWINYDRQPIADVIGDWTEGLPFKTKSLQNIFAAHVLEHVVDLRALKAELSRILEPAGYLEIIVPNYLSIDAWGDDTHVRAFSLHSFHQMYWPGFNNIKVTRINCEYPDWYIPSEGEEKSQWLQVLLQRDYQPFSVVKLQ